MEKMHKRLTKTLGGYWRRLKRKNPLKGFTLVELIVVIVILAILAAILIPGLLKWIDQAKDKKYELEAREIGMAAEAALTKVYAKGGLEITEHYSGYLSYSQAGTYLSYSNLMDWGDFKTEMQKLTDAKVKSIELYGSGYSSISTGHSRDWGGSLRGYKIYFVSSDDVKIFAQCLNGGNIETDTSGIFPREHTDGWEIKTNPEGWKSEWD